MTDRFRQIVRWFSRRNVTVAIALLMIALDAYWIKFQLDDLFGIAFASAQCSLLVIWSMTSVENRVLRFTLGCLSWFLVWNIVALAVVWGTGSVSMYWALVFLLQATLLVCAIAIHKRLRRPIGGRFSLRLRTMVALVTAIAITLASLRWAGVRYEWNLSTIFLTETVFYLALACFNSLQAIACLWVVSHDRWPMRLRRFGYAQVALCLFGQCSQWLASQTTTGFDVSFGQWMMLLAIQTLILLGVMMLVDLAGNTDQRRARLALPQ